MNQNDFEAVVLSRRALTGRIAELTIGAADGRGLPMAEAGSHVALRFGAGDDRFLRHYSVVGPLRLEGEHEPFWRIAVQREDRSRGSAFIHDRFGSGTRLRLSRPLNAFRLTRKAPHTLLVAGGIGVTPMVAMARSLRWRRQSFSMLYAGQDRSTMAYVAELEALCAQALTLHEARHDGHPDFVTLLSAQPAGTLAYVCGPPPMIEALRRAAASLDWTRDRVRSEVFDMAHAADDTDFAVRTRSGRTIRVGAGTTILDALEAAGVDTLSDCRRGDCGLCITDVVGCDGILDHRDRVLSEDERRAGKQMTLCCSRIKGRLLELDI